MRMRRGSRMRDEVGDGHFGDLHGDRRIGELGAADEPVQRAVEVAPVGRRPPARRSRATVSGMRRLGLRSRAAAKPDLEDAPAHGEVGAGEPHDDAALHARAHALVDPLQLGGRPVRRHHDLLAAIQQRVEKMAEFLLHALAGEELHVVDQKVWIDLSRSLKSSDERSRSAATNWIAKRSTVR